MKPRDPHRRFRDAVKKAGGASHVADRLCCTRQYIYDLMNGQKPGREIAVRISSEFGIGVGDWGEPATVAS
jgi:hypothetical protein